MSEPLRRPNRSRSTGELRCTRGNGPRRCGGAATCKDTAGHAVPALRRPGRAASSHRRPAESALATPDQPARQVSGDGTHGDAGRAGTGRGSWPSLLTVPTPGAGTGATSWRPWHSSAQRMGTRQRTRSRRSPLYRPTDEWVEHPCEPGVQARAWRYRQPPSAPRRVLVTGPRTWTDTATIRDALASVWGNGDAVLVSGASPLPRLQSTRLRPRDIRKRALQFWWWRPSGY